MTRFVLLEWVRILHSRPYNNQLGKNDLRCRKEHADRQVYTFLYTHLKAVKRPSEANYKNPAAGDLMTKWWEESIL